MLWYLKIPLLVLKLKTGGGAVHLEGSRHSCNEMFEEQENLVT